MNRFLRPLAMLLAAFSAAFVLTSCGEATMSLSANFDDVGDLAVGAPVTMADIQIGKVSSIKLAENEAVVTMEVEEDAKVPEGASVRVRRTSVLGERIVDIVLPEDTSSAALLEDGAHIDDTSTRTDLEDLVDEGSDVLGAISAGQLAVMIEEGAKGFGGRGTQLGNLLSNYKDIVGAYNERSGDIVSLIRNLKGFNDTLAQEADAHALSIQNTAKSINVLQEESLRLEDAIVSLGRLARGSRSILTAHVDEMDRFFQQSRVILRVLAEEQEAIADFLYWAPGHNYNTQAVEYDEFNQVIQDFVICGLNEDKNNAARTCTPTKGKKP